MSNAPRPKRIRLSAATLAGDARSPVGWIGALSLHVLMVGAMLFTFTHKLQIIGEEAPVVPVELVTIGEKTNITPTVTQKAEEKPDLTPQMQAQPDLAPPEPNMAAPDQAEVAPPDLDIAKQEPLKKAELPKKPVPAEKKKSAEDEFAALLDKAARPQKTPANAKLATRAIKGFGAMNAMTAELQDAFRSQVAQCWNTGAFIGAPHPEQLIVNVEIFLNPDGSVARAPQLDADSKAAATGNPFMRAANEAVLRAIETCAPYRLPADRYADWRDFTATFNPRDMLKAQ